MRAGQVVRQFGIALCAEHHLQSDDRVEVQPSPPTPPHPTPPHPHPTPTPPHPTCIEWKLAPGCTLKKAIVFQVGSRVAVGITPGSLGVPAPRSSGGRGGRDGGRARQAGEVNQVKVRLQSRRARGAVVLPASNLCSSNLCPTTPPTLTHPCPAGTAPERRRPPRSTPAQGLVVRRAKGGKRCCGKGVSLLAVKLLAQAGGRTLCPVARVSHSAAACAAPPHGPTSQVDNVRHAAVANHVVVAQQVAAGGVHVAGAVGLIGEVTAACGVGLPTWLGCRAWATVGAAAERSKPTPVLDGAAGSVGGVHGTSVWVGAACWVHSVGGSLQQQGWAAWAMQMWACVCARCKRGPLLETCHGLGKGQRGHVGLRRHSQAQHSMYVRTAFLHFVTPARPTLPRSPTHPPVTCEMNSRNSVA